ADTLNGIFGANLPRYEDRKLVLSYSNLPGGSVTMTQYIGNGQGWNPLPNFFVAWPMSQSATIPANDTKHVDIEISIALHTIGTSSSQPLQSHLLGLGVMHKPVIPAIGSVGFFTLPNIKGMAPQDTVPSTWATLDLNNPLPIPMSFAMWNVGQLPPPLSNTG